MGLLGGFVVLGVNSLHYVYEYNELLDPKRYYDFLPS